MQAEKVGLAQGAPVPSPKRMGALRILGQMRPGQTHRRVWLFRRCRPGLQCIEVAPAVAGAIVVIAFLVSLYC